MEKRRRDAREQLIRSILEISPSLVGSRMMHVLEPMKADVGDIRKPRIADDKLGSRYSREVYAVRAIGQATQDQAALLVNLIEILTTKLEEMVIAQPNQASQPSSSEH